MKYWFLLLSLLLFPMACTCVLAQIVNIEDQRVSLDTLGWHGRIDLGANLTKNTNSVTTLSGSVRLDRLGQKANVLLLADYKLIQVSGANAVNAGFLHARYGYELKDPWRWESFTQLQYNEQLRLTARWLIGTGIRRRLYRTKGNNRAYFGLLYMYEYDEISESDIFYRDHRLSGYLTFRYPFGETLTLANTTYYQPRLPDFTVPRISSVTNISVSVTTRLQLTSNFSLTFDERINRDVAEVPATTYQWTNGLRYVF